MSENLAICLGCGDLLTAGDEDQAQVHAKHARTPYPECDDEEDWVGSVEHSLIDSRVWVAVLPDTDMLTGAMGASTSLRICKRHVEKEVAGYSRFGPIRWEKDPETGSWNAYAAENNNEESHAVRKP